ncbi:MAG: hypothetical protein WDW38_002518 [Sanguina aurantia]
MELAAQTDPSVHRELSRILAEAMADAAAAAADAADDAEDAAAADEAAAAAEAAALDSAAKGLSADASFAGMQSREIRNMKVKDIRELLDSRNLPSYGNRYELQERLGLEVANAQERQRRAASVGGDGPPMSIREMRKRLSELGLQVSGTRVELEARLAEFAQLSAESAREAAQQQALEEDGRARRLDPRAKLLLGYEPSASVAVICAWPAGDLIQAEACLVAARTLVDQLQTAPLQPLARSAPGPGSSTHLQAYQQALMMAGQESPEQEGSDLPTLEARSADIGRQQSRIPAMASNGVSLQVFFLDAAGKPRLLTAGELFSCSAQDLVLLGRPTLGSVQPGQAGLLSDEGAGHGQDSYDDEEDEGAEADSEPAGGAQLLLLDGQTNAEAGSGSDVDSDADAEAEAEDAVEIRSTVSDDDEADAVGAFVPASESWQCPGSLQELADALWDACVDVVVPIVSPTCSAAGAKLHAEVVGLLEGAGLAVVGTTPEARLLPATNGGESSSSVRETLQALSYPTLPAYKMDVSDLADVKAWAAGLSEWCEEQGWDSAHQRFVVKPARGIGAQSVVTVLGLDQLASAAARLMQSLAPDSISTPTGSTTLSPDATPAGDSSPPPLPVDLVSARSGGSDSVDESPDFADEYEETVGPGGDPGCAVIIEPLLSAPDAYEFSVVVVQSPAGPVALMPHELELYDADREISIAALDHAQWGLSQEGLQPEALRALMVEMTNGEMAGHTDVVRHGRHYPQTQQLKYHSPPRLSHATIHHIRHAACKLFLEMGLSDVARFDGWAAPDAGWARAKGGSDTDVPTLPDPDPFILQRMLTEQAIVNLNDPTPLSAYYDTTHTHSADLDRFDPSTRLFSVINRQATIFFTDVNVDIGAELGPGGLLFMQAAEVGMVPAAAIRNVLNSALRRSGSLLELPAPPLFPSDLSALRLNVYPDSVLDADDFDHPAVGAPRGDGLEDILTAFQAGFHDDRAGDEDEASEGGGGYEETGEGDTDEGDTVDEEMDWDELSLAQKERLFRMEPELWEEDDSAVSQAYREAISIMNAATAKEVRAVSVLTPAKLLPAIASLAAKARPAADAPTPTAAAAEDNPSESTTTTLRSAAASDSAQSTPPTQEAAAASAAADESAQVDEPEVGGSAGAVAVEGEDEYQLAEGEGYDEEDEFYEEEEEEWESMGVDLEDERSLEQVQDEEAEKELSPRVSQHQFSRPSAFQDAPPHPFDENHQREITQWAFVEAGPSSLVQTASPTSPRCLCIVLQRGLVARWLPSLPPQAAQIRPCLELRSALELTDSAQGPGLAPDRDTEGHKLPHPRSRSPRVAVAPVQVPPSFPLAVRRRVAVAGGRPTIPLSHTLAACMSSTRVAVPAILVAVLESQCDDDNEVMEVRLGMGNFACLYDRHADLSDLEGRALLVYTGSPEAREVRRPAPAVTPGAVEGGSVAL